VKHQPIPISSARSFLPYLDFMIEIGAPVERWLEQHRLPFNIHEDPDSFVPTMNYWEFVSFPQGKYPVDDSSLLLCQSAPQPHPPLS